MQKWEYRTSTVNSRYGNSKPQTADEEILQHLIEMGSHGWELVSVASNSSDNDNHRLYFKRPSA